MNRGTDEQRKYYLHYSSVRQFISWIFLPFSMLYGFIIHLRNLLYDRGFRRIYRAPVPVISVGNISAGGTGKTPFSEYLMRYFAKRGVRAGYLSRGYGRRTKGFMKVDPGSGDASTFGDEAFQVASHFPSLPVAVCADRQEGIRRLVSEYQAELIILDDAFQHRKVARDLDIVMIDANRLPIDDRLLPSGRLREPRSGLKRADVMVVNKIKATGEIPHIRDVFKPWGKPVFFTQPQLKAVHSFWDASFLPVSKLQGAAVVLFSGIGNPDYFVYQVRELDAQVVHTASFPDHYRYTKQDFEKLVARAQPSPTYFLTTEKDFFRLKGQTWLNTFAGYPFAYLTLEPQWPEGEPDWLNHFPHLRI